MIVANRLSRRRSRRCNVMWPATLLRGQNATDCTILDVSERGARIQLAGAPPANRLVTLKCDRFGALDATVMWARGTEVGLRFAPPLAEVLSKLAPHVPGLGRRSAPALPDFGIVPRFGRKARVA